MSEELQSLLVGTLALDVLALVAVVVTIARGPGSSDPVLRRRVVRLSVLALLVQVVHFVEELASGFNEAFPDLLGLGAWSRTMFASFNLTWIAAWVVSIVGVRLRWRAALFPVWFLGIACVVNAVAHPLMALARGEYFPGLWTSPFLGVVGYFLLKRMGELTTRSR